MSADVTKRRKAYVWFLILALVTLVVAFVDILVLDSILKYGVYAALIILFILAILFLFAASEKEDVVDPADLDGTEHLHCPHCAHVFAFHTPENTKGWKRKVSFSCPECGNKGVLPPANASPVEAVVPGGEDDSKQFHCRNCAQEWSVGAIGHRTKKKVAFDACPSCHSDNIQLVA